MAALLGPLGERAPVRVDDHRTQRRDVPSGLIEVERQALAFTAAVDRAPVDEVVLQLPAAKHHVQISTLAGGRGMGARGRADCGNHKCEQQGPDA